MHMSVTSILAFEDLVYTVGTCYTCIYQCMYAAVMISLTTIKLYIYKPALHIISSLGVNRLALLTLFKTETIIIMYDIHKHEEYV